MSIYRTYFNKNNTIVCGNKNNFGRNPITEISYGIENNVSRFIFDINIDSLVNKIIKEGYSKKNIKSHKLVLYNTISNTNTTPFFRDGVTQRTSSFTLDLFSIDEKWNEGSGYKFTFENEYTNNMVSGSNWYNKDSVNEWNIEGVFDNNNIINTFYSEYGDEDIIIDVTDYINGVLFDNADHNGLGLKFSDEYENLKTKYRQAVAYHTRHTHTYFEPYLETDFDDIISDDRNNIIIGENNVFYLNTNTDIIVNRVEIVDYEDNIIETLIDDDIVKIKNGVFKIEYSIDSEFPDMVMFYDKWYITDNNNNNKIITQRFVLKDKEILYNKNNFIDFDNYHISISGIKSNENIKIKNNRRIDLNIKKKYHDDVDLSIYYNLYVKLNNNNIIKIIDKSLVNKQGNCYWFDLDLEYLIPHRYTLDIIISDGKYEYVTKSINFDIVYENF